MPIILKNIKLFHATSLFLYLTPENSRKPDFQGVLTEYNMRHSQLTFICSKSTIATLGKEVKYVIDVVLVFLLLTLNIFHTFL